MTLVKSHTKNKTIDHTVSIIQKQLRKSVIIDYLVNAKHYKTRGM